MAGTESAESLAIRLECDGLRVEGFAVPPFRVRAGQAVCLHVRLPSPVWQDRLLPILTAKVAHPAVRFFGSVGYLKRPMPHRRWWGWLQDPLVRDWLIEDRGLMPEEAADILGRVALPPDLRVGWVGWNERSLLALEAALLRVPDVLVFDTTGNDPAGARRVFERLTCRPANLALLYLKTQAEADAPCLPGSTCFALERCPAQPVIAE
jgi:hypothetical protein